MLVSKPSLLRKLVGYREEPFDRILLSLKYRYYWLENLIFERRHSFDFRGHTHRDDLDAESAFSLANATHYSACTTVDFKILMDEALSTGGAARNFIDIGCGKGKQCFYAAKYYTFEKITGIDFSNNLIEICNKNLHNINYKNINFFRADATEWKIPDGESVVFLFNPFNDVIMNRFISLNIDHFKKYNSIIVYANDIHRDVIQRFGFEIIYRSQRGNSLLKFNPKYPGASAPKGQKDASAATHDPDPGSRPE